MATVDDLKVQLHIVHEQYWNLHAAMKELKRLQDKIQANLEAICAHDTWERVKEEGDDRAQRICTVCSKHLW